MKYLVVDASLNGTGIRDYYEGIYILPETLGLNLIVVQKINEWLSKYASQYYNGFVNASFIDELDKEGREIALMIKDKFPEVKIEYFSAGKMKRELL